MPKDKDHIIMLGVPKGLFDPPGRALTPEEKSHPSTFFGVTAEMRKERLAAIKPLPPRDPNKTRGR